MRTHPLIFIDIETPFRCCPAVPTDGGVKDFNTLATCYEPPPGGQVLAGHGPDAAIVHSSCASAASGSILSCPLCNDTQHVSGYGSGAAEPCQLCIGRAS